MKNFGRVVIGSIAGSLMGAAMFFVVDGLVPQKAEAQVYGVHVTSSSSTADKWVKLTDSSTLADKWVRVLGRCRGNGDLWVKPTDSSTLADEWWKVTDSATLSDMDICLSGDIESWFENVN